MLFYEVFTRRLSHLVLQLVEQQSRKLVNVHLFRRIYWLTIVTFESVAKTLRIEILLLAFLKCQEECFKVV